MKFIRLNDTLILPENDTESGDSIKFAFPNCNDANFVILCKNTATSIVEFKTCDLINGACSVARSNLPDGSYTVKLCEKGDNKFNILAIGRFKVAGGVVSMDPLVYSLEVQDVWRAIAYIAEKLSVDEANIDKLVTGYVTE